MYTSIGREDLDSMSHHELWPELSSDPGTSQRGEATMSTTHTVSMEHFCLLELYTV